MPLLMTDFGYFKHTCVILVRPFQCVQSKLNKDVRYRKNMQSFNLTMNWNADYKQSLHNLMKAMKSLLHT